VAGTLSPFDAVIFDLDGVVTDTASVHLAAWRELLDSVLQDKRLPAEVGRGPFTDEDYRQYVDGRSRQDGLRSFLASRGAVLPQGPPGDAGGDEWTIAGLAERKDQLFIERIRRQGVKSYPGTVDLLVRLRAGRVRLGLVTASRHASMVLAGAGLEDSFDAVVDGVSAAELGLPGKPEPAVFLEAARRLGVDPCRSAVVEDAVAGVEAARRGGFGLVVGLDRNGQREELEAAGADVVLEDLSEFDIGLVLTDPLLLVYEGFDPAQEGHREALTTLGNGYLATRGAAPERPADRLHYPGTYLAGVYNRLSSVVEGRSSEDEHMVNAPNWLTLDLALADGKWWSQGGLTFRRERRELDLRRAVLRRSVLLEDDGGRQLEVVQRRVVSMAVPHLAALETVLVARGWSGPISVRSGIDADVANTNVPEYSGLASRHLVPLTSTQTPDGLQCVEAGTSQSHVRIATALRTSAAAAPLHARWEDWNGQPVRRLDLALADGTPQTVSKIMAVVTSRDRAVSSPRSGALAVLAGAGEFKDILAGHEAAWKRLWNLFEVGLEADPQSQLILNLHVFHLLQTITGHTAELDAGVPARGLHGEGYRGHIFWDELFVLPLVTSRLPSVSRALLDYRWRRLGTARAAARSAGLPGALFPWQSGSDGREETPEQFFNPRSGRWVQDHSRLQRHVGLAVAFNAWQYFQATGDRHWLLEHGAELIIEVARLFSAMAEHDKAADRFHLRGVMGPDEYHDGYPDRPGQGLDDNAYTNVLAAWICHCAASLLAGFPGRDGADLRERLRIGSAEPSHWEHIGRRMFIPFHDGIISQFDGYEDLAELDWGRYRRSYGNIERLDLILEAEGDSTNRYRLAKQADVLMLLYLFGEAELIALAGRLDYHLDSAQLADTVDYYLARTAHGSTLSRVVHASVLAARDPDRAWHTFREALDADLDDTQGGTTRTGIHLGAMAGTIDVVQRTFAGLRFTREGLVFSPLLPAGLRSVTFRIRYRDQLLKVGLNHRRLRISAAAGDADPVPIRIGSQRLLLEAGEVQEFGLETDREPGGGAGRPPR
jgi:beta-phosphoglucomutase family hydrolase